MARLRGEAGAREQRNVRDPYLARRS